MRLVQKKPAVKKDCTTCAFVAFDGDYGTVECCEADDIAKADRWFDGGRVGPCPAWSRFGWDEPAPELRTVEQVEDVDVEMRVLIRDALKHRWSLALKCYDGFGDWTVYHVWRAEGDDAGHVSIARASAAAAFAEALGWSWSLV